MNICDRTIITTSANPLIQPIHTRMPLILDPHDYPHWLDQQAAKDNPQALLASDAYPGQSLGE